MPKLNKDEAIQWYAQNRGLFKKLSAKINSIILELLEENTIAVHAITNRTKEIESFRTKIDNPKYDDPAEQVTDLAGIRIIAYVEDDLKPICKILEDSFHIDPQNSLDKTNELGTDKVGYRSIHYIARLKEDRLNLPEYKKFKDLKFEIQVRTILQHAWAEIEHDRNYKFNGVLPPEIKRRFKILAGTLELADREFNQLSLDIDKISNSVLVAEQQNILDSIELNSTTLKQFLITKFNALIKKDLLKPILSHDNVILNELNRYGIKNLKDLDSIVPINFIDNLQDIYKQSDSLTFIGLLRDIMIINNADHYFQGVWRNSWGDTDNESFQLYKRYNIDPEYLTNTYGIGLSS
ncbi:hypothetical protein LT679_11185 [Mucilaginibacter roseus]|uniref:RelA/SpoT domain-containing protein n=1 Tax=Mucilaginibacter roseus TaxID=1528868 RepID=A0ABS8U5Q7_9SPHI|nr:hypothetical protein [Mucilaginibacter roseus]MCD8741167.1 hypothetical protein [Mucilaginibacter roseus]